MAKASAPTRVEPGWFLRHLEAWEARLAAGYVPDMHMVVHTDDGGVVIVLRMAGRLTVDVTVATPQAEAEADKWRQEGTR